LRAGAGRRGHLRDGSLSDRTLHASRAAVDRVDAADSLGAASRHGRTIVATERTRRVVHLAPDDFVRLLRHLSGHHGDGAVPASAAVVTAYPRPDSARATPRRHGGPDADGALRPAVS